VVGDGRELPFEDGSFDAVVCHTSLCHIPEPERVLAEALRVAAESGARALQPQIRRGLAALATDHIPAP
jgi:ubiquinone/menaquinone biosynthesis C-methylase UbiE